MLIIDPSATADGTDFWSLCGGYVLPEVSQAVVGAKQGAEDCGVSEQNIARPITIGRHPEKHVEFCVACFDEWVRPRLIDWLFRQHVYRSIVGRHCVMR